MHTKKERLRRAAAIATATILPLIAIATNASPKEAMAPAHATPTESGSSLHALSAMELEQRASVPGASDVTTYETENSRGTVVFIPQYHKDPSTNNEDTINDLAVTTQNQIYDSIKYIHELTGISTVLVEGELAGNSTETSIAEVSQKMSHKNQLRSLREKIKKPQQEGQAQNESVQKHVLNIIDTTATTIERDIILRGAPYKLAAEGAPIELLGLENKDTQDESRDIIRTYVYLRDRIAQLSHPFLALQESFVNNRPQEPQNTNLELLQFLLQGRRNTSPALSQLHRIAEAQEGTEISSVINEVRQIMQDMEQSRAAPMSNNTALRHRNPYSGESDMRKLEARMAQTEEDIQHIVIDKRNREAAENTALALREKEVNQAIVQYGAGHEQGLIEELQKQGLSVVVVTPIAVSEYRNADQNK